MGYLIALGIGTGLTGIFMMCAAIEAGARGLTPVPVLTGNPHTVRERLGYEPWIETSTAETSAYTTRIRGTAQNIITGVKCRFATAAQDRGNRTWPLHSTAEIHRPMRRTLTMVRHATLRVFSKSSIHVLALAKNSFWLQADTPTVTSKWMPMWQSYTYTPDIGGIFETNILSRYPEEMKCSNAGHAEPSSGHSADGSRICAKPTELNKKNPLPRLDGRGFFMLPYGYDDIQQGTRTSRNSRHAHWPDAPVAAHHG